MVRIVKAPEERRSEIVEAARILFLHKGYESTTMHDVMKALGVAKGTIYHYYGSKQELLDAVLRQLIESERQRVQKVFDALQGDALNRFRQLIIAISLENHDQAFIDSLHKPANAGMHVRLHAATVTMLAPFFAELCKLGIQEGVMQAEHPLETSEFILAATTFLTDIGIYPWSTERLRKRIIAMPDLIERQLGAPPGSFAFLRTPLSEGVDLENPNDQ
jgi:AcrR family transcriptional regulator